MSSIDEKKTNLFARTSISDLIEQQINDGKSELANYIFWCIKGVKKLGLSKCIIDFEYNIKFHEFSVIKYLLEDLGYKVSLYRQNYEVSKDILHIRKNMYVFSIKIEGIKIDEKEEVKIEKMSSVNKENLSKYKSNFFLEKSDEDIISEKSNNDIISEKSDEDIMLEKINKKGSKLANYINEKLQESRKVNSNTFYKVFEPSYEEIFIYNGYFFTTHNELECDVIKKMLAAVNIQINFHICEDTDEDSGKTYRYIGEICIKNICKTKK